MNIYWVVSFCIFLFLPSCVSTKEPGSAEEAYQQAKELYDEGSYEQAVQKFGSFRSRYPYSRFVLDADLYLAHSYFLEKKYPEAIEAYQDFLKLHPKYSGLDFVYFRIGECFWEESPSSPSRAQEYTEKAVKEWTLLVEKYPSSQYVPEAKKRIEEGLKKIVESELLVAEFYNKQGIWHACAYRYLSLVERFPDRKELLQKSLIEASLALERMVKEKEKPDPRRENPHFFFKTMSDDQILIKAQNLKLRAEALAKSGSL